MVWDFMCRYMIPRTTREQRPISLRKALNFITKRCKQERVLVFFCTSVSMLNYALMFLQRITWILCTGTARAAWDQCTVDTIRHWALYGRPHDGGGKQIHTISVTCIMLNIHHAWYVTCTCRRTCSYMYVHCTVLVIYYAILIQNKWRIPYIKSKLEKK